MFYYLNGTVAHIGPFLAVIDCGGVGYECKTTNYTLSTLRKGEQAKLYTIFSVRQDGFDLFGFSSLEERNLFQMLTGVSGVGPKAALSILSTSPPSHLALSIITGDVKSLTAAQGVGKKIAQRIVLELKDKLAKERSDAGESGFPGMPAGVSPIPEDKNGESSAALAVLGYSQGEINAALRGLDTENLSVEEVIKAALRRMVK